MYVGVNNLKKDIEHGVHLVLIQMEKSRLIIDRLPLQKLDKIKDIALFSLWKKGSLLRLSLINLPTIS